MMNYLFKSDTRNFISGHGLLTHSLTNPDVCHATFSGSDMIRIKGNKDFLPGDKFVSGAFFRADGKGSHPQYGGIVYNFEGCYEIAVNANDCIAFALGTEHPGWTWINTQFKITYGTWYDVVMEYSFEDGKCSIYVNGRLVHEETGLKGRVKNRAHPTCNDFFIGGRIVIDEYFYGCVANPFVKPGGVDEVFFEHRAAQLLAFTEKVHAEFNI